MSRFRILRKGLPTALSSSTFPMGMNLSEVYLYSKSRTFANIFRHSDQFYDITGSPVAATVDAQGWPTNANGTVARAITAPEAINTPMVMTWEGKTSNTSVAVANLQVINPNTGIPFPIQSVDYPNRTLTFTCPGNQPSDSIYLKYQPNGANYPVNIDMRPVAEAGLVLGIPFATDFARFTNSQGRARVIKMLPSVEANTVVTWAGRATLGSDWSKVGPSEGVCIEAIVALCNALNINLHYSISWNADDAFVTGIATYVRDNLNSGLVAYYECSNEVWNWNYAVTTQALSEANAAGLPDITGEGDLGKIVARLCKRHKEMMILIDAVYSGVTSRRKRILANQHGLGSLRPLAMLGYSDTINYVDCYATAPYINQDEAIYPHGGSFTSGDVPGIIASISTHTDQMLDLAAAIKTAVEALGVEYLTYEGGINPIFTDLAIQTLVTADAAIYGQVMYMLQEWERRIGSSHNWYQMTNGWAALNPWGLKRFEGETIDLETNPRGKAVIDFRAGIRLPFAITGSISSSPGQPNGAHTGQLALKGRVKDSTRTIISGGAGQALNSTTMETTVGNSGAIPAEGSYTATIREAHPGFPAPGYLDSVVTYDVGPALNNTHAYRYYRLYVTATPDGSGVAFTEMELAALPAGADTTSGQTYSAFSEFGGPFVKENAFDDNTGTSYASTFVAVWPQWLKVDYGATAGNWKAINQLKITARTGGNESQAPGSFKLQGSDDDSAWTDLITQTGQTFSSGETKTYVV